MKEKVEKIIKKEKLKSSVEDFKEEKIGKIKGVDIIKIQRPVYECKVKRRFFKKDIVFKKLKLWIELE